MTLRSMVLTGLLCALLLSPAPAHARQGPCVPGEPARCTVWNARVVGPVNDGDTFDVRQNGRVRRIRVTGIQATELDRYNPRLRRGQCHAVEATRRLERILRAAGNRVRLSAMRPGARASQNRLLRGVAVRRGGRWRDVGEMLVREGHAFWMPDPRETAWNDRLNRAAQLAAPRGRGVWDPDHCGAGPRQDAALEVWVRSDPVGIDTGDVNGEWVTVHNRSASPVALGGWSVRTPTMLRYRIPAGTTVPSGRALTVHVGRGSDRGLTRYWGLRRPVFANASELGGGAFLFDPQGDVRAAMLYPCVVACSDPRQGALTIEARPGGPEQIVVRNRSASAVDLYGLQLALRGSTYPFREGARVPPGAGLVVEVRGDPSDDTAQRVHWGVERPMLVDAGGAIRLTTFDYVELACDAWGNGQCVG